MDVQPVRAYWYLQRDSPKIPMEASGVETSDSAP
jgi:hypothetical protein